MQFALIAAAAAVTTLTDNQPAELDLAQVDLNREFDLTGRELKRFCRQNRRSMKKNPRESRHHCYLRPTECNFFRDKCATVGIKLVW